MGGAATTGGAVVTGGATNTGVMGLGAIIVGIVLMVGFGATTGSGVSAVGAGAIKIFGLVIGAIVATGFTGVGGVLPTGGIGLGCRTGG